MILLLLFLLSLSKVNAVNKANNMEQISAPNFAELKDMVDDVLFK
jgi:hypothetical protein